MYPYPSQAANRILETRDGLRYVQIGADFIDEFTRFVYRIFTERISRRQDWQPSDAELQAMIAEERILFESGIFVAALLPDDRLVAAMRVARGQPGLPLPTERIFALDRNALARMWDVPPRAIWHASQMCVDTPQLVAAGYGWRQGIQIMRGIVKHLFRAGSHLESSYGIMESDEQINAYLKKFLNIETWPLSSTRDYIGQTFATAIDLEQIRQLDYVRAGNEIVSTKTFSSSRA